MSEHQQNPGSVFWECDKCGARNYEGDTCPYCGSPRMPESAVVEEDMKPASPEPVYTETEKQTFFTSGPFMTILLAAAIALICTGGYLLSRRPASYENISLADHEETQETGGVSQAGSTVVLPDEEGYAEGEIGDVMRSVFMDFTVNSAAQYDTYGICSASPGTSLLVMNVTMKNTMDEVLPMYDSDFYILWENSEEGEYAYPISYYDASLVNENMLETEYEIEVGGTVTGDLVFEIPKGNTFFGLVFEEYFTNEESGDIFIVYIDA